MPTNSTTTAAAGASSSSKPQPQQQQKVPREYVCPITGELMDDPVMDREGNTYERVAILQWLERSDTSPITRNPLLQQDLAPNRALRDMIEVFMRRHGISAPPRPAPVAPKPVATKKSPPPPQQLTANHNHNNYCHREPQPQQLLPPRTTTTTTTATDTTTPAPLVAPNNSGSSMTPLATDELLQLANRVSLDFWHDHKGECLLSVNPPAGDPSFRQPVDIVCVIDVSGSMSEAAKVQDEKGVAQYHGLSLLDVVKHAARTVSAMLSPHDRFAIVSFSDSASLDLNLTYMNDAGKKRVVDTLDVMRTRGRTNLWDGLQTAMDLLTGAGTSSTGTATQQSHRAQSVILLTDGCPNMHPPRGEVPTLRSYIDRLGAGAVSPFTVHTFGFGYDLDSNMLNGLAREANGMFVFIPDSGLVGTVFVNCVANLLSALASNMTVSVETPTGSRVRFDTMSLKRTKFGACGTVGALQFGQSRDFFFVLDRPPAESSSLFAKVELSVAGQQVAFTVSSTPVVSPTVASAMMGHSCRNYFCAAVTDAHTDAKSHSLFKLSKFITEKIASDASLAGGEPNSLLVALKKDVEGEVTLSFKRGDNFSRWGRHYLLSLVRANELQQCNNFKDKSVQQYGGKFFAALRDDGETTFLRLPPPAPTRNAPAPTAVPVSGTRFAMATTSRRTPSVTTTTSLPTPQLDNMDDYYNSWGGCIAPQVTVALRNGQRKRADEVRKGDTLLNGATVRCVVKIRTPVDGMELLRLKGGGEISFYHPIRKSFAVVGTTATSTVTTSSNEEEDNNKEKTTGTAHYSPWTFPCEASDLIVDRRNYSHDRLRYIYNYVLDSVHTVPLGDDASLEMVTFGHGLTDSDVVRHEFFGNQDPQRGIVARLKQLNPQGFDQEGSVVVPGFTRDPTTNRINGFGL